MGVELDLHDLVPLRRLDNLAKIHKFTHDQNRAMRRVINDRAIDALLDVAGVVACTQGMNTTIPELFAMLKAAKVEIKKEHQVLMVNKTTSFKKKGKGKKKGNFKKNNKQVAAQEKKPKYGHKPETGCFYCKGTDH